MNHSLRHPVLVLGLMVLAGCGDDARRPLGASCAQPRDCESGACVQSICVDPATIKEPSELQPVVAYVTRDNTGTNLLLVALGANGSMVEHPDSPFGTATGNATELVFSPDAAHAFVGSGSNGQVAVTVLDLDPVDFSPSANPYPPIENNSGLKEWDNVAIHPSGGFIYAADTESDGDRLYVYAVNRDLQSGQLTQVDQSSEVFQVNALAMDPKGRYLIACNNSGDYGVFDLGVGADRGGTLGEPTMGDTTARFFDVHFNAAGDAVYMLATDGLFAFDFDASTGALSEVLGSPFEVGGGDMLVVAPQGGLIYEAGRGAIYLHRINPTGTVALVDIDDDALNGLTGYLTGVSDLAFDATGDLLYATGDVTTSFAVADDGLLQTIASVPVRGDRISVLSLRR